MSLSWGRYGATASKVVNGRLRRIINNYSLNEWSKLYTCHGILLIITNLRLRRVYRMHKNSNYWLRDD